MLNILKIVNVRTEIGAARDIIGIRDNRRLSPPNFLFFFFVFSKTFHKMFLITNQVSLQILDAFIFRSKIIGEPSFKHKYMWWK